MPDDNSCLFRALSAALLPDDHDAPPLLRRTVADLILADPSTYTAAVLGRPPAAYAAWITHPDAWGGGIELAALSLAFAVEVCAVNVADLAVLRFNEAAVARGASRRVVLVYSGIHYDVVALTPYVGADADLDQKVFDVDAAGGDSGVLQAARELCRVLRERRYYTDTGRMGVRCNVCGWEGKGETEATGHARDSGHMDFGEC